MPPKKSAKSRVTGWNCESYASGQLLFRPDFANAAALRSFASVENATLTGGALTAIDKSKIAQATVLLQTPYVFVQANASGDGIDRLETSIDDGKTWRPATPKDFGANLMWDMENLVVGAPRNWARTVIKWNLALDEKNGPKIAGGADNCRGVVTIRQDKFEITREVEYYGLGLNYPEKYPSLIQSVTREEVLRVARKYLHPKKYVLVIVANLKPAKLMGIESNGMVLAGSAEGGKPFLVGFETDLPPGSRVR